MDLSIVPLTPARIGDLAMLFDQGGDPKWCWCMYFRVRGLNWTNSSAERNRDGLTTATRTLDPDRAPGLVAYRDDEVVGWVSLGPREDYERLAHSTVMRPVDDTPVWSIVCFVVGRHSRKQGVARAMLDAAIDYARDHGATTLEAYPTDTSDGRRLPAADAYRGTLSMFEQAGFQEVTRRASGGKNAPRPVVRRSL